MGGRLSRLVVGAFLLVPIALVATPAAQAVTTQDLTHACAAKKSGVLRYVAGPGGCTKNETLVTFSVAGPVMVCVDPDGSVRKLARISDCAKTNGTVLTIPSNSPAYFCINLGANRLLRYVQDPSLCRAGETAFVVVNHPPTDIALSDSDVDENVPVGTVVGTLSATDPDAGDTFTFNLVPGTGDTDNAAFSIVGNQLRTNAAVDYETQTSYSVRIGVTDRLGLSYDEVFTITVTDIVENLAPTDISLSNDVVAENQPAGTSVGTLTTTDPDVGDTHTYTLVTELGVPNHNGLFQISGAILQTAAPLDHEGAGPTYVVTIQTDDGSGGTFVESFTITAADENDPPSDISLSNNTVAENQPSGTTVGNLSATDQDAGDSHVFSLVAGFGDDDNAKFQIVGSTLQTAAVLDFEDQSSFTVRVRADDGNGGTFERSFTITASDANDAPTDLTLSPDSVTEGEPAGTTIGTLSASDPDFGDTHSFTLVAGVGDEDNAKVTIDGTTLKTAAVIDFGTDPVLKVRVRATDGSGSTFEEAITVTVVNVNTAPTQVNLSNSSVAENAPTGTTVGTLSCVDDPGDIHTFTLVSGAGDDDNGAFAIVGDQLQTNAVFDFEDDASKTIRVRCEDQLGGSLEQVFLITVNDANEAPTDIALSNASVDENQPTSTTVGTLSATDPDAGDTHTFSLVSGTGDTDNASFQITGNTLKTNAVFNFEVKDSYSIRVRVTDSGGATFEEVFTISVIDVNDAPTAANDSYSGAIGNTLAVLGTTASGPNVVLTGNVTLANDSDEDGDTITAVAEIVSSTGGGTATINSDGSFVFLPGVGDKNQSDTFTYKVTDGLLTSTGTVTVGIVNELVWYVDDSAPAGGDGRSTAPLNALTALNGAGGAGDPDSSGDWIFLYSGTYGPISLEVSQRLYGEPAGLEIAGHPLVAAGGANPTINAPVASNGILMLNNTAVRAVNVVGSTNGAAISIAANNASLGGTPGGTVTVTQGTYGVAVGGGSGTVTIDANITNTAGGAVRVQNRTGGSVSFLGNLAASGVAVVPTSGVELTNNTGAAINFSGALTLNTGAQAAFSATGGGTLTVNGPANTLNTTTGIALRVQDTTVTNNGLQFRSISSNGAPNGILLQNTGNQGGLNVFGNSSGTCGGVVSAAGALVSGPDLADCTGGSILNSTGAGIVVQNGWGPFLNRMRIAGNDGDGIFGSTLNGFTVRRSVITNNGDAAEENGIDLGDSAALAPQGAVGFVEVSQSTITGSADSNIIMGDSALGPNSQSAAVLITLNRIANADSAVGATQDNVQVEASGSAVIGLTVSSNSLAAAKGDQVQVNAANGAGGGGTFNSATIQSNQMSGGGSGAFAQGVTISAAGQNPLWTGSVKYDVAGNVINGAVTHAVTISLGASGVGGSFNGFVRDNQIGTTGQALSCSTQGNGMFVKSEGSGTSTIQISNNIIRRCFDRGVEVTGRDGNGVLNATVTGNTVTEMSDTNSVTSTPREAFQLVAGSTSTNILGGIDSHTVCLSLTGNSLTGGAHKISDIRAQQRIQTRVTLPGYGGTAFDTAAVQALLSGNNGGATATATANDHPGVVTDGYFNSAACTLPTP